MAFKTKGLQTAFFETFDATQTIWPDIAMEVQSTTDQEEYGWLGALPAMREMHGERIPKRLADYDYTLKNKEFEASVAVRRADLKDDQTGKYGPMVRAIAERAKQYPDKLIMSDLLPNGFTNLAYDGQYFFDTDHASGDSGSQSNKGTSALDATSFAAARAALMSFKDDAGEPVNRVLDLRLIVPAGLVATAESLVEAQTLSTGGVNTNYGKAKVVLNAWATDSNDWFLINVAGVVKPFVVQQREFIPFESLEDGSETDFMRKEQYFGTYWRGNAGYGLWQRAYGAHV